ncbi:hypothetical protein [Brevifollis gellanilyticus]|uniref:Uncharacterized protein n=1 Tax=Brevifollis gellanilyticus TaxID=748831 RepID=A0A512MI65_9BACT|nr:hypothetical protein [Brevifollis gellanilyticus]GEP46418.1 hypothetical protein BGE01nite_57090 [Brevifollis gellanilyticus]
MKPGRHDFQIDRGVDFAGLLLVCLNQAGAEIDLSAFTPQLAARRSLTKPVAFTLSASLGGGEGEIMIAEMSDTQTAALPLGDYLYDLVLEDDEGRRWGPCLTGNLRITDIVTRPTLS